MQARPVWVPLSVPVQVLVPIIDLDGVVVGFTHAWVNERRYILALQET